MKSPCNDSRAPFHATRWSLVQRVKAGGGDGGVAMADLCEAYWFPLYGWARRSGVPPADAEDLVQGFFADVVRKNFFGGAESRRGRLRTYLLTAFRRYQRDQQVKAKAQRRGSGRVLSLDALAGEDRYLAEREQHSTPAACFDRQWALTLLERAMARVEDAYSRRGRRAEFVRLQRYLGTATTAGYREDAEALGISEGAVKAAVHRLRARYREALRDEVAATQGCDGDIDGELAHLLAALGG